MGILGTIASVVLGFVGGHGSSPQSGIGPTDQPSFWDRVIAGIRGGLSYGEAITQAQSTVPSSGSSSGGVDISGIMKIMLVGAGILAVLVILPNLFRRS